MKTRFRGSFEHALDNKGRLNFPSKFRELLRSEGTDVLMITAFDSKCLRVYTLAEWEAVEDKLLASKGNPAVLRLIRSVNAKLTECCLDKQGRLLLPAALRSSIGVDKEVVLNGALEFVEIWPKESWLIEEQKMADEFSNVDDAMASMELL